MSNVYILPRNQQQQRKLQQQPPHFSSLVGSGGQRKLIASSAAHGTVVATRSRLVYNNNRIAVAAGHQQHRYLSSPYPPINIRKPMLARRVILAPPQFHHQPARFEAPPPTTPLVVDHQSEEDEFDVDEVYQLLEESAGHRMQDAAEAAMPRRRERLTNLTAEEKMNRRKQKNRIAAQAARDRRKETTKRLEDSLRRALLEIGRLKGEVKLLRAENERMGRDGPEGLAKCYYDEEEQPAPPAAMYYHQPQQPTIHQRHPLVSSTNRPYQASIPPQHQHQYQQQLEARNGQKQAEGVDTANQQQQHKAKMATMVAAQQQPKSQPTSQPQQQPDSLGSAASFSGPLPRERESSCNSSDDGGSSKCLNVVQKCPMLTLAGTTKQQRQLRMACLMKVLMALWSIVCTRREKTSSFSKSSTSFSKSWTFQSMWTASATRSLRRALLRRMLRMDVAKLAALCNSPQQQLVAHFHHTVVANANRKARGRQRSLARCPAMVDLMLMEEEAEDGANSSMDIGQSIASTLMMASEEADGGEAVVPEALPTRR